MNKNKLLSGGGKNLTGGGKWVRGGGKWGERGREVGGKGEGSGWEGRGKWGFGTPLSTPSCQQDCLGCRQLSRYDSNLGCRRFC